MKEKDFQSEFGKRNTIFGVFELKFCKGKSLPFSCLADHQEAALLAVNSHEGHYHKITDQPFIPGMTFQRKKPFDCFRLRDTCAYVVVMWWHSRRAKAVYYIPIEVWVNSKNLGNRKSITEAMAANIAYFVDDYMGKGKKAPSV